ncbi:MAG TPA: protein kinase [Clostridiaceae bacterium]|nr:protein kinase [Clostridiaceae bacterium]
MTTLFNGRYRIIKALGSGGMGTVYLAENVSLGTKWAIKAIDKKASKNYDLLAEPNILKKLNHPALPRIIDIEEDDNFLYIIEDYIEGTPLDKQLQFKKRFDEGTVIEWAKQLCNVLLYLHNQKPNPIIYRDMKPSNIIVTPENVVKVIDFGIAREFKKESASDTSYMGTRGYAAPEQYGTSQTDARTDIYSLGVTLYHLLTGKSPNEPPYEFKPLRQVDKNFSEGIEYIVNKCVQNDPAKRYQNVAELLHDLENMYLFNSYYKKQKALEKVKFVIKGVLVAGFSALIYLGSTSLIAERVDMYNKLIDQGYQYLDLRQFNEAFGSFSKAIELDKSGENAYIGIASILLKQANYEECLSYMDEVEEKMPEIEDNAQYNYLKGTVYYEERDYEKAVTYLERACDADTSSILYLRDLAVCYAKVGDLSKARRILGQINRDGISDDVIDYIKGQVLLAEGDKEAAIESFKKVINSTGDEHLKKRSYLEISDIYKSMRHDDKIGFEALDKQIEILEQAVKDLKNEDDLIITEAMAEAYFTAKYYDLSIEKFKRLLELGYDRAYIYRNIAIIYQQTGEYEKAEEYLKKMMDKYPDNYQCYLQLAFLYLETESLKAEEERDYKKVLEYYNLAVKFAPEGENTSDLLPLARKIEELKEKKWL